MREYGANEELLALIIVSDWLLTTELAWRLGR
jgi:hypothetical protein